VNLPGGKDFSPLAYMICYHTSFFLQFNILGCVTRHIYVYEIMHISAWRNTVRNDIRPNKVIIMKYKGLKVYHEARIHAYVINRTSIMII